MGGILTNIHRMSFNNGKVNFNKCKRIKKHDSNGYLKVFCITDFISNLK